MIKKELLDIINKYQFRIHPIPNVHAWRHESGAVVNELEVAMNNTPEQLEEVCRVRLIQANRPFCHKDQPAPQLSEPATELPFDASPQVPKPDSDLSQS
jgi:hypothetical protein